MNFKSNGDGLAQDIAVFEIARSFASTQDVDTLLGEISAAVETLTGSEAASILLLDSTKTQLVFRAATGDKGSSVKRFYVPLGKGVAGWVAEKGEAVIVNDVHTDTRFTGQIDKSSGFSTRSILAVPLHADGQLVGVCEALNKVEGTYTDEDRRVLENLGALAAQTISNARAAEEYRNFFSHMIEIMTLAIESRDPSKTGHSYRVAELACRIGRAMGLQGQDYKDLYYASILHDIGLLAGNDPRYLPSMASRMERTPERMNPLVGAELVKNIKLLASIGPIIRHHRENMDGTGSPMGLRGGDIPLGSRILALAESLDDLQMRGLTGDEFQSAAAKLATSGAGTRFDPVVVEAFLSLTR